MFHLYTLGKESKQFLIMTPAQAKAMNDFTDLFFDAQARFKEAKGYAWSADGDFSQPLDFQMTPKQSESMDIYNRIVPSLNKQHAVRNRLFSILRVSVRDEELDDYWVKRI